MFYSREYAFMDQESRLENNESLPEEHVNYQSSQHPVHGVEELSSPNFQIFEYV